MWSTPSLNRSHLFRLTTATMALILSAFVAEAQSCGTFTMNQNPYNGYDTVGSPINDSFNASFTLNDVKVGQTLRWFWSKNGTEIPGTADQFTKTNGAAAPFNTDSTYNGLVGITANVDHSGDYRLTVESTCAPATACTCTATFYSQTAVMRIDPTISVQPAHTAAVAGASANLNVTANDGLGGSALIYNWYRYEPDSYPNDEVLVGSTSGASTSNISALLDLLSKTGDYFVRVTHNRGGSNPDRSVYGLRESSYARVAMTIPNSADMAAQVCRTPSWQLNNLGISPDNYNPTSMAYEVNDDGYFSLSLGYSSSRFNGIGSCSSMSQPPNSYNCYDSGRSTNDSKRFYIQVPTASVIQTAYHYKKNGTQISGTAATTINPNFDSYYDNDAQNPTDDGAYLLSVSSVPCGTAPGNSNTLNVDVVATSITINAQYAYAYDNTGDASNQVTPPANPNTVVRGGMYLYVSASHPTQSLDYQWQKFNGSAWVPVPADASGFRYYGQTSSSLTFYDDSYGDNYNGMTFADAGQYRLRIQTADSSSTVYSATFTVGVYPQAPSQIYLASSLQSSAGAILQIPSVILPLEATQMTYNWEIRNLGASTWTFLSSDALPSFVTAQGNYEIRVSVFNTTVNKTTAQPVQSATIVSSILSLTVNPPPALPPSIVTQPQNVSVADGQAAIFQVSASGGLPLTYQWQESLNMGAFTNVGVNSPVHSFIATYDSSITSRRYRVIVGNSAGNVTSSIATLTVNAVAPSIISHPANQNVPEGAVATFAVVASGTAPLTYQWQESLNMAAFTNISGATTSVYQITATSNPAITSRRYRAIVTNGGGSVTSNPADLTIQAATCSAPSAPNTIAPAAGSQGISLLPTLSWQPVSVNPSCTVTYDVRVSLTSAGNCQNPVVSGSTLGTIFGVSTYLQAQTNYFWCVRAQANGIPGPWTTAVGFTTTTATVPTPTNLYTLPYTTPSFPAGNQQIILGAMNGEPMATGIFYLKQTSGDVIVGSTIIGNEPGGRFEVSVDVTTLSALTGPREFYARQQRAGQVTPGEASESVIYYYDAGMSDGLMPPALQKNDPATLGSLKWNTVDGATQYRVYRRVNTITTALPSGQALYSGTDGLGPKPYTLLPNVNPTIVNGVATWTDTNLASDLAAASLSLTADGVSYFVTAVNAQNAESARSNSQSFQDTVGPLRSQLREGGDPMAPYLQQIFYLGTQSGRSARGYLCNINPAGYFHGPDYRENSADIIALVQVKVKPVNTSCSELNYDSGSQSYAIPFDSIETVDVGGFNDCIFVGEVGNEGLIPTTDYCFKTCLRDTSNNSEQTCLEGTFGQTLPDGEAPDFAGVDAVTPREDGTSLLVEWNPPTYQEQILEPITYIVTATNKFAQGGEPIFDDSVVTKEVESTEVSTVMDNLSTGRTYCIRVAARDEAQNQAGNSATKCGATLNNNPFIDELSVSNDAEEAQKINISFKIVDRQQDGVMLSKLAFKNADVPDWIQVASSSLSGNSDFLASADSISSAPAHKVVFDSLPYFIGQRENFALQLTFKDIQGNETVVETAPTTAFYSNSRNASYSRTGLGCTASARAGQPGDVFVFILCMAGVIGAMGLRLKRQRAFTGITK